MTRMMLELTPSLQASGFSTTAAGGHLTHFRSKAHIHGGFSVDSGLEPGTLRPRSRDLLLLPPRLPIVMSEFRFRYWSVYYTKDTPCDVLKATEKLKAVESELITAEEEYPLKRKRKLCKRFNFNSDEESSDDNINPTSKNVCRLKVPKLSDDLIPLVY
ncbi:hypothetical protein AVEN_218974-1 [Araneus ventricosus]|uniref:Uncharacterized protein n=1 Tax=Araneus ventricosus TaxID=182803 RepID=A0A4Y2CCZ0_ARAVE|nr:hypothetical protein AVEN_218974-1 [Araneus ventricosus]